MAEYQPHIVFNGSNGPVRRPWEKMRSVSGRPFYVNHNTKTTTWRHPHALQQSKWTAFVEPEGPAHQVTPTPSSSSPGPLWIFDSGLVPFQLGEEKKFGPAGYECPHYEPGTAFAKFTLFPQLASETRIIIWKIALNSPQAIKIIPELFSDEASMRAYHCSQRRYGPSAALLITSKESRYEALKCLELLYRNFPSAYCNPLVDTLIFDNPTDQFLKSQGVLNVRALPLLESVAVPATTAHVLKSSTFTLASSMNLKLEDLSWRLMSRTRPEQAGMPTHLSLREEAFTFPGLKQLLVYKYGQVLGYAFDGQDWNCAGYEHTPLTRDDKTSEVPVAKIKPKTSVKAPQRPRQPEPWVGQMGIWENQFMTQDRIRTSELMGELGKDKPALGLPKEVLDSLMQRTQQLESLQLSPPGYFQSD